MKLQDRIHEQAKKDLLEGLRRMANAALEQKTRVMVSVKTANGLTGLEGTIQAVNEERLTLSTGETAAFADIAGMHVVLK